MATYDVTVVFTVEADNEIAAGDIVNEAMASYDDDWLLDDIVLVEDIEDLLS